ncbi:MAG: PEP-CTERM sorting domain-containing protein [Rubripirellula sp.]
MSLISDSSTVRSDTGGTVAFMGTLSGDPGDQLQAFDIVIDIANRELPSSDVSIENLVPLVFAPFNSGETERNGDDIFFGGFSPLAVDAASDLQLFTFDAVFRPGITAGQTFDFNLDSNDSDFSLRSGAGLVDLSTVQFNHATVLVTAVPEPSSLIAIAGLACGCAVYRRRRRT